jgi:hypothetical protein
MQIIEPPSRRVALLVCLIPALYFYVALIFALFHFADYGSELPQFLRYIAAPFIIAIFLSAVPWLLSTSTAAGVGLTVFVALLALFALEFVLTVKLFFVIFGMVGGAAAIDVQLYDGLPPGATIKALNNFIKTVTLPEAALSGIPLSKVYFCNRGDEAVIYMADRNGFNNPDDLYSDVVDVVMLGDSFVEGFCLKPGTDVLAKLRETHPRTIGLASRGSGPLFELAMLERFGSRLRPKTVIIAFFEGNDWENLAGELQLQWLSKALEANADFGPAEMPPEQLQKMRSFVSGFADNRVGVLEVFKRTNIVRNFLALHQTMAVFGLSYPKVARPQPAFHKILTRAKEFVSAWNSDLKLVYIPQVDRYRGLIGHDFAYDSTHDLVLAAAKQAGVGVIDLTDLFWAMPDPAGFYAEDSHLSERGAAQMARIIAQQIAPAVPRKRKGQDP